MYLILSFRNSIVIWFIFSFMIHGDLILYMIWHIDGDNFYMCIFSFSSTICWEFFFLYWIAFATLKKSWVDLDLNSLLCSFNIVVNFSTNSILCLLLKLYNKNKINPEVKYCLSSNFALLQSCFSILSCLHFHINLRIGLSISTKNKACWDID